MAEKNVLLFLVILLVACSHSSPMEREEVSIRQGIKISGSDGVYKWTVPFLKDESSPTGYFQVQSCQSARAELAVLLPSELELPIARAFHVASAELGPLAEWDEDDFLRFDRKIDNAIEEAFPGNFGFYWEFRESIFRAWGLVGGLNPRDYRKALCGTTEWSNGYSSVMLFDLIVMDVLGLE